MATQRAVNLVKSFLKFEPNDEQLELIHKLIDFYNSDKPGVFILTGYAGTGKTSIISAFIKALKQQKLKYLLLAPTGRAAKILQQNSGSKAYTIHSIIYKPVAKSDSFLPEKFELRPLNVDFKVLTIVDEASMISTNSLDKKFGSGNLLKDLIAFLFSCETCNKNKLIIVGDKAQLPPVNSSSSKALEPEAYQNLAFDLFSSINLEIQTFNLKQVNRYDLGILYNATILRNLIENQQNTIPKFKLINPQTSEHFPDFKVITGREMIDYLMDSYQTVGKDETLVITYSNKRANAYNIEIRNRILTREGLLSATDKLMIIRNNYYWLAKKHNADLTFRTKNYLIANGDIAEILKIYNIEQKYGLNFAKADLKLVDFNEEFQAYILLDTLVMTTASIDPQIMQQLFQKIYQEKLEQYQQKVAKNTNLTDKKSPLSSMLHQLAYKDTLDDPYLNALHVKYAYAVTCHKAQGGQWKHVYIDFSFWHNSYLETPDLRWLYTAITRATEKVFLVNFPPDYFEDADLELFEF